MARSWRSCSLLLLRRLRRARRPRARRTPIASWRAALELHQAGDILGAIDAYKAALAIAPTRADALSNLGAAYVRLGQYDEAIKQYEAALKADALNNAVRLNLALAYYKSARPNDAIPQLKRVVSVRPRGEERLPGARATATCRPGRTRSSSSLLKPREQMFGGDLAFAYLLGTALLRHGRRGRRAEVRRTACSAPANRRRRTCCSASRTSASTTIARRRPSSRRR